MRKYLPSCPLTFHNYNKHPSNISNSDYSSTNSSLTSQSSLHSIPSLTPPSACTASNPQYLTTLKGHSSYISTLTLTGNHLYSGSFDGEIRVWNPNPNYSHATPQNYVVSEGYSAVKSIIPLDDDNNDNDKLITAHQDHKIRIWKIDQSTTGSYHKYKLITTLPTVNDRCMKIFSDKNYVNVRRHKKSTWVHHNDTVSSLALSKDKSLLYSVSWDRTLKVWRTIDYKCVESIENAHDDAINDVVLSEDGHVYTCSADKMIKIWKSDYYKSKNKHIVLVSTLEKHKSSVNALAISCDGCVLYSGACDRSIIVWEKDDDDDEMVVVGKLRGHKKPILCLAVVMDIVCSGSADKSVRVWRRGSGSSYSCLAVFEGHNGPVKCLTACLDSNNCGDHCESTGNSYLVYSGGLDFDIKIWQIWVPNSD